MMHLVRSHKVMYIHIPQVVMNLILQGRDFTPPVLTLLSSQARGVITELAIEECGKKS